MPSPPALSGGRGWVRWVRICLSAHRLCNADHLTLPVLRTGPHPLPRKARRRGSLSGGGRSVGSAGPPGGGATRGPPPPPPRLRPRGPPPPAPRGRPPPPPPPRAPLAA